MYLKLNFEVIAPGDNTLPFSRPDGSMVITGAMLYQDNGQCIRGAEINNKLLKLLSEVKIEIPEKKK